jgi:hypothetical protein
MPLYITVSRGPRADAAIPVLASSDRHLVGAVLQTLARLDEWDEDDEEAVHRGRPLLGEEDGDGSSV